MLLVSLLIPILSTVINFSIEGGTLELNVMEAIKAFFVGLFWEPKDGQNE
jgi:hypothetical protein